MELIKVAGDTYVVITDNACVIGVYIFPDRSCLLIDSGPQRRIAQKLCQFLRENGLHVAVILNTHAHSDHTGGNKYIQDSTDCAIYARPREAVYITYPELQVQALYTASVPRELNNRMVVAEPARVTEYIVPGFIEIKSRRFEVLDLAGHSMEHCGFITPDEVLFAGDALIADDILQGFPFIYIFDLNSYFTSLDYLAADATRPIVAGHGGLIADTKRCCVNNRHLVEEMLEQYKLMLASRAMSREEILQETIGSRAIIITPIQYYMFFSTVSAYLTYLIEHRIIRSFIKDGVISYKSYPLYSPDFPATKSLA